MKIICYAGKVQRLVVAAAVAWSTAPFFVRLVDFGSWTILFWRGAFGGNDAGLGRHSKLGQHWKGVGSSPGFSALAMVTFIWLREVASARTLIASLFPLADIAIGAGDATDIDDYPGNWLGLSYDVRRVRDRSFRRP